MPIPNPTVLKTVEPAKMVNIAITIYSSGNDIGVYGTPLNLQQGHPNALGRPRRARGLGSEWMRLSFGVRHHEDSFSEHLSDVPHDRPLRVPISTAVMRRQQIDTLVIRNFGQQAKVEWQ